MQRANNTKGCIWYFKGTNSKANHNFTYIQAKRTLGVFGISKVQIQKQITTSIIINTNDNKVYLVFQRYKFKSKSQLSYYLG